MKIGIISDTHGDRYAVDTVLKLFPEAELWFHAGDCTPDAGYLALISGKKVHSVAGNCDWPNARVPEEMTVDVAGHRIFLTHGHTMGVKYGVDILRDAAKSAEADIAIYGHTHAADIDPGAILVLNPGSAARPRDEREPSFMKLTLEEGKEPKAEIVRFDY